ncbi:MAG: hypothetical protein Q7Q73_13435 [Verrucomicrobiota bacterium JB024]|nr:hypothetical protein [Verrucomicrobiota bacterium JB024]
MAFLLVLIVSLSSFTRVESLSATASLRNLEARQNAVFGLYEAMGELQKYAGPDQRVTATAEILDNAALQDGGALEQYSKWTGVWDSSGYSQRDGDVKPDPRWLVSLDGSEAQKAALDPADVPGGQEWIQLVSDARGTPVEAALVNTDDGKGAYAWWVGDEGVKADIHPRRTVAYDTENNAEFLAPVGSGYALATNDAGEPVFTAGDPDIDGRDLWARDELAIVASTNKSDARALYHDVTTYSRGLLTDTKNGGLRYDLTTALASPTAAPQGPMITDAAGNDLLNGYGPDWQVLRSFWELRADAADGSVDVRGHRSHDWSVYTTPNNSQLTEDQLATPQHGVAPVVTGFQLYFYPLLNLVGGDETENIYECRLYYMPEITIWNPYNVTLTGDMEFDLSTTGACKFKIAVDLIQTKNTLTKSSARSESVTGGTTTQNVFFGYKFFAIWDNYNAQDLRFKLDVPEGGIAPGQALTFRLPSNVKRPGNYKRTTMLPNVSGFGGGVYETSTNTITLKKDDIEDTTNNFYLNPRIHSSTDSDHVSPHPWNSSWLTFRLYSLDNQDNVDDLLAWQSFIGLAGIAGHQWYYHKGLMPLIYVTTPNTSANPESSEPDDDDDGGTSSDLIPIPLQPGFGIEAAISLPEVAAFENASSTLPRQKLRLYADTNMRASRMRGTNTEKTYLGYPHFTEFDVSNLYPPQGNVCIGPRDWVSDGWIEQMVLFDIPSTDILFHSIGQLSMANLVDSSLSTNYQVGNSHPNLFLEPSELYVVGDDGIDGDGGFDWSYLLNEALWDKYFFSTYDPNDDLHPVWHPQYVMDEDAQENLDLLEEPDTAAAHLAVDGMFNVNSTSVEAWKVLLSAFYGDNQTVRTDSGDETLTQRSPFLRFQSPVSHSYTAYDGIGIGLSMDPELYTGYRTLSEAEITALASYIVDEVKKRGPFLSMAEFVNRQYNPASTLSVSGNASINDLADEPEVMGALQSAIEKSGLNQKLNSGSNYRPPSQADDAATTVLNDAAGAGSLFADAPGYFSQIDILSRLGSIMSARSDVFVIRTYGRAINPLTEETQGEAWLEAIVERTVTPVEPSGDNRYEPLDPDVLGRQFKIVGFRWLSPEEV